MESVAEYFLSSNVYTWCASALGILLFIYWQGLQRYNSILGDCPLPGPKPWPWVGSLPDVFKYGGMHKMFLNYFYKYGRVHKMCWSNPSHCRRRPRNSQANSWSRNFGSSHIDRRSLDPTLLSARDSLISRDETWKRIRNTLTPTFTATKPKQIVPTIDEASQKLSGKTKTFSETGKHAL